MSACRAEHHHVWIYSSCKVHARHQLGLDISRIRIDCPAGPCARGIQNRRRPRRGVVPTVRGSCLAVDVGHCRRGPGQPRSRHVRHAAGTHGQVASRRRGALERCQQPRPHLGLPAAPQAPRAHQSRQARAGYAHGPVCPAGRGLGAPGVPDVHAAGGHLGQEHRRHMRGPGRVLYGV